MIREDILIEYDKEQYLLDVDFEADYFESKGGYDEPPYEELEIYGTEITGGQLEVLNSLFDYSDEQLNHLQNCKGLMNAIDEYLYTIDRGIIEELSE